MHERNSRCTERKIQHTVQEASAVLPRDHFLCKIKYCKYDGNGHTRPHVHVHIYPRIYTYRKDRRAERERERGVFVSFFFRQGETATKSVLYETGIVRNTHADVETFDIVNLIFPRGAPVQPPYVFPPISAAVSEDSGLPNRSPTVVLKYTERVGSSSFSHVLYLFYLSLSLSPVPGVSRRIQSRFIFTRNSIEVHR